MADDYACPKCGKNHDDIPLSFGAPAPDLVFSIPEAERNERCDLTSDQCVVDEKQFFILARLVLPIVDGNDTFTWQVWVAVSEENFDRVSEMWEQEGREDEPAYTGWLATTLPYEISSFNLKLSLQTCPVGTRPLATLEDADHPLVEMQRTGITRAAARTLVEQLMHGL